MVELIITVFNEVVVRVWVGDIRLLIVFGHHSEGGNIIRVVLFGGGSGKDSGEGIVVSVFRPFLVLNLKFCLIRLGGAANQLSDRMVRGSSSASAGDCGP